MRDFLFDIYPQGVYISFVSNFYRYMLKTSEKKLVNRLRIIKGQVGALEKMVTENEYCPDIIRLSLAIQKSLQSFNQVMLENHLQEHVSHQFKSGKDKQAIKELSDIYSLNNK
jgi:CsoR family transcriptional regulator, copper-sensing transcriptional repressor